MNYKTISIVALLFIFYYKSSGQHVEYFNKYFSKTIYNGYELRHSADNLALAAWGNSYRLDAEYGNKFLVKELSTKSLRFSMQKEGHLAEIDLSHSGGIHIGDLTTSLGYGKNFGQRLAFAVRFHYLFSHAQGYEALHSFTFDLSIAAKITSQWLIGVSVFNPAHLKYGVVSNEYIPMRFNFDLAYSLSDNVLLALGIRKELAGAFRADLGGFFALNQHLIIDFTCAIPQPVIQLSINILWHSLCIRFVSEYQFSLGLSPLCGISYEF